MNHLALRTLHRVRRTLSARFAQRMLHFNSKVPLISFSFDDFPRSALRVGGAILKNHGVVGTYYASLALMDRQTETGLIFGEDDLHFLISEGHELGCHTYAHCPAWETSAKTFERSVFKNAKVIDEVIPGYKFATHSYPISNPRPATKRRMAKLFSACRGGGQDINSGVIDLNSLKGFFLEQSKGDLDAILRTIDRVIAKNGWLIFATHDIAIAPTRFGVSPNLFEEIVRRAVASGAHVVPLEQGLSLAQG